MAASQTSEVCDGITYTRYRVAFGHHVASIQAKKQFMIKLYHTRKSLFCHLKNFLFPHSCHAKSKFSDYLYKYTIAFLLGGRHVHALERRRSSG